MSVDHPPHETQPQKPEERQNLSKNSETEAQVVDHQVSSPSSRSDSRGDTPTHEKINYDYNVFSDMKMDDVETQATQPSNSSNFLISRSVDYPPHELQSEKPEERENLSESSETEAQNLDHHVVDSSTTDVENSRSNVDLRPPVVHQHQESIDAVSMNTFSSLSPRSLSPDKTLMDQVSSSAFNQHISSDVPQLNIEDMTQEPPTSELLSNTKPPIMQPLSIEPVALTHTSVCSDFQEPTCLSTMADDCHITDTSVKLIFDDVDRKENDTLIISRNTDPADLHVNPVEENISCKENDAGQEKFRNGVRSEDKSTSIVRQDDSIPQMKTLEEINNKTEVVENDEVTSSSSKVTLNVGISTNIEDDPMAVELAQNEDVDSPKPNKPTGSLEEVSVNGESKKDNNEEEIKGELKDEIPPKSSMLNDSSAEENNVHSEPMKNHAEINEKLKNYIPANPGETNDGSEEANEAQSESKKISNKEEIKQDLKNDSLTKLDKPNDNWDEVSKVPNESKKNYPQTSNKEEAKDQLNNDTPAEPNKPNESSEEVSKVQGEPKQNDPEMSNKVEIKGLSNNDTSAKSDKQDDSSGEASKVQNEPNDDLEKVSDIHEEPKEVEDDMEKHKWASANIPKVNEVTSSSSVEVTEAKNNEVIEQESNKKDAMVLSSSVGTSEDGITINVKEPKQAVNFEK
ncbi:uncharacterized protein LOC114728663 [Neltuma alba]|uniref:uncharacterized protein LOC114728663 n=1 Tax=Neltuma alba TaxID=207710 RepID=UPI0010A3AB76|nr:uncharacterized protein LOC114728663 [Prosopis alba]